MGTYAVTGSASGMGSAVAARLRGEGHEVIGVDLAEAEVRADLATPDGRVAAIEGVLDRAGGRLDGAVTAAGLASGPGAERTARIAAVNYLGTVELLTGWRQALARAEVAKVVAFCSNSAMTAPVPADLTAAVEAGDADAVRRLAEAAGPHGGGLVYAATKVAIARWVRRAAVAPEWIGAGIRLNAIAPGVVLTPMVRAQMGDGDIASRIRASPLPTGELGDPADIAEWVALMLSPAARFLCGSVIVVDGGTEAWFRGEDWPAPNDPARYAERVREFDKRGQ